MNLWVGGIKSGCQVAESVQLGIRTATRGSFLYHCAVATMNRLMKRDSTRGRYALLANDWNNNTDLENGVAEGGEGGAHGTTTGDPRPDKRYIETQW